MALLLAMVGPLGVSPANALAPTTVDSSMWQVNGRVRAIVETPDAIYLGGQFTSLIGPGAQRVARTNLAALDPVTGAPLPFVANVNKPVWNLAVDSTNSTVYAVGDFTTANGVTRRRAAAFAAASGALRSWNPNLNARGKAVDTLGSSVYLGGEFTTLGGQARSRLAAVDATSGALQPGWGATANDIVATIVVSPDGSRVLAGGVFTSISGSSGSTQRKLASLHPTTGVVQPWASHPSFEVFDLEVSGSQLFAAAGGSGGHAVAWNLTTGQEQWTGFGDGDAVAVEVQNGVLYIGGHMTKWNGVDSGHLIAVDTATGVRIPWSIKVNSNLGIFSLASNRGHLSIGGDFTKVNNLTRQHYARFSEHLDTVPPSTPGKPTASAGSAISADLEWPASTDSEATSLIYTIFRDHATTPVAQVRSSSTSTVSFTDTDLGLESTHTWRVQASDGENLSEMSPASDPLTLPASEVPLLLGLDMLDADLNGTVDSVEATFSSAVSCTDPCLSRWTLSDVPSGGSLSSVNVSGNTAVLALAEGAGAPSTALGSFTVALEADPSGIVDAGGDQGSFVATAPRDAASPVPVDFESTDGVTANFMEPGDTFTAEFSEAVDPATVIAATVKELDPSVPGTDKMLIVGLTDGLIDLHDDNIVKPDGGTVVYKTTLTMLDDNTAIRSTVTGTCSGTACSGKGFSSDKDVTFVPEPTLKDFAGNPADGSHTEPLAIF